MSCETEKKNPIKSKCNFRLVIEMLIKIPKIDTVTEQWFDTHSHTHTEPIFCFIFFFFNDSLSFEWNSDVIFDLEIWKPHCRIRYSITSHSLEYAVRCLMLSCICIKCLQNASCLKMKTWYTQNGSKTFENVQFEMRCDPMATISYTIELIYIPVLWFLFCIMFTLHPVKQKFVF